MCVCLCVCGFCHYHCVCLCVVLSLSLILFHLQEQFIFIHDVILESIICGDTEISAGKMGPAITKLRKRDRTTGKTQFEAQFEVCTKYLDYCLAGCKFSFLMQVLNQVTCNNKTNCESNTVKNNNFFLELHHVTM